ncbi:hypothetical protein [Dyadobacter sp. OTU695]|uniref:hypothetical protein n=1 Tax=Dyadobacter sp. OTU695 TaxID=3043860 RepID=UPI00313ACACD
MTAVNSLSLWAPIDRNRSGIRRLKLVDSDAVSISSVNAELIPLEDLVFYEFIFPNQLACVASFQRQIKETGAAFWLTTVSFSLPHINNQILQWVAQNPNTEWLAIAEDYNGNVRALGGTPGGMLLSFDGNTGARPGDANPMNFALAAEQIQPFTALTAYENAELFTSGEFDYSFDFSFTS